MTDKTNTLINDVASLDSINMTPIIAAAGGVYDIKRRINALTQEIENGSHIETTYVNGALIGYIQCSSRDNSSAYINSLQIHPQHRKGAVLRKLFRNLVKQLNERQVNSLTSRVHQNNEASIRLHRRLGFSESPPDECFIAFTLNNTDFKARADRYIR
ncbi:hypothetical protein CS022_13370 [Veronia nyctiphanis]|uniref:N-acetyltransferase domain-containing protein n=1 Tax=Veronia nyctiphanis TaxID=1278244 RepID=A0A4Q0YUK6_9GAMM|nr:GNAT family N-acetyltransferase [Veronia nyctiphanis]RXJ72839.1 hypothetical protein CS022_13370 [Veronia nyctiphanis]